MKRLSFVFFFIFPFISAFANLQINQDGSFRIEGLQFFLEHFTQNWKYTRQTIQTISPEKQSHHKGVFILEAQWKTQNGKVRLTETVTGTDKKTFSYHADMEQIQGETPREIALSFAISPELYADSPCLLDGKPLKFGKKYNPADWQKYFPLCEKIEIPLKNGMLEISGNFGLTFQDVRRFQIPQWGIRIKTGTNARKNFLKLNFTQRNFSSSPIKINLVTNMAFADQHPEDGKGGWTDEGPTNDMRTLPLGKQRFAGIEFDILNPQQNRGTSCIALRGIPRPAFPSAVTLSQIPTGKYLYVLHAVGWHNGTGEVGKIKITANDNTEIVYPVNMQHDVGNFWNPTALANGAIGFSGRNAQANIGLYVSCFPLPVEKIKKITFESSAKIVWLIAGVSVSNDKILYPLPQKQIIKAGDIWKVLQPPMMVKCGSILDFSTIQDAPAGKYGFVKIRDSKFSFENAPDKTIRFYGANLCFSSNIMEKKWSKKLVHDLSMMGYNSLRLHHVDPVIAPAKRNRSTDLDPAKLDNLDYLFYLCKQQGIYLTTDLYCWRTVTKGEIPELGDYIPSPEEMRAVFLLADSALENWKEYVRNLLAHKNPYTGMKWKDDPALYAVNLINEDTVLAINPKHPRYGNLYKKQFEKYVRNKQIDIADVPEETVKIRFLTALYRDRFKEMKRFLRDELKTNVLITDQNMWNDIPTTLMRNDFDLIDNHIYFDHPHFLERAWWLPAQLGGISGVMGFGGAAGAIFPTRLFNKPFIVTEYDHVPPAFFAVDGAFLMGAYGAFQDWNGLYHFAYSHHQRRIIEEPKHGLAFFDLVCDTQRQFAERAAAVLFTRGDVSPAHSAVVSVLSEEHLKRKEIIKRFPLLPFRAGLLHASGTVISQNDRAILPENAIAAVMIDKAKLSRNVPELNFESPLQSLSSSQNFYQPDKECFTSDTGELVLDRSNETFCVKTPKTEAFLLRNEQTVRGNFIKKIKSLKGLYSAVLVTAHDNQPLQKSKRILILHLTESKNSEMIFRDRDCTILETWGIMPMVARHGKMRIEFNSELKDYKLYSVNFDGSRIKEIYLQRTPHAVFTADNFQNNLVIAAYELVKE